MSETTNRLLTLDEIKMFYNNTLPERWNTTHLETLFIAILENRNSPEKFKVLMNCLKKFTEWRNKQPNEYIPPTGLETMYSKGFGEDFYDFFDSIPKDLNDNETLSSFENFIIEMKKKHGTPRLISKREIQTIQQAYVEYDMDKCKPKSLYSKLVSWKNDHPLIITSILVAESMFIGYTIGVMRERSRRT